MTKITWQALSLVPHLQELARKRRKIPLEDYSEGPQGLKYYGEQHSKYTGSRICVGGVVPRPATLTSQVGRPYSAIVSLCTTASDHAAVAC